MITLTGGNPQTAAGLIVPNGSVGFQLNVDATVIAAPHGFVSGGVEVVFQFNETGSIQPNAPAAAAQIYSNAELNPQNIVGLGTYYLVTFYDADGARINKNPMWWQFPEAAGSTVDISNMTPISTVGGNVIFYPTDFSGGGGSVTSVSITGDGTIFSTTPSTPVTAAGTLTPTLLTQNANLVLAGPTTGGAATPTFRSLVLADLPAISLAWSNLQPAAGDLALANTTFNSTFNQTSSVNWTWANITAATNVANQSSPSLILAGRSWDGAASITDQWSIKDVISAGTNPIATLTFTHAGSSGTPAVSIPYGVSVGLLNANTNVAANGALLSAAISGNPGVRIQGNTPASGVANISSGTVELISEYWNGAASADDTWKIKAVLGTGTNPSSTLSVAHTGSSGSPLFSLGTVALLVGQITSGAIFTGGAISITSAAATGGGNVSSYNFEIDGSSWDGASAATDKYVLQNVVSAGTNAPGILTWTHTGLSAGRLDTNFSLNITGNVVASSNIQSNHAQFAFQTGSSGLVFPISAAGNASAGKTTYTVVIAGGAELTAGQYTTIAGFATGANNGRFIVFSCTTTSLVVYNGSGSSETHVATGTVDNPYYANSGGFSFGIGGSTNTYSIEGVVTTPMGISEVNQGSPAYIITAKGNATDSAYLRLLNDGATGNHGLEIGAITDGTGAAPALLQLGHFNSIALALFGVPVSTPTLYETTSHTPSSAADTGVTGQIAWDASFIYICTATNTWKRVGIATW